MGVIKSGCLGDIYIYIWWFGSGKGMGRWLCDCSWSRGITGGCHGWSGEEI